MSAKIVCQNYFQNALSIHRSRSTILFDSAWSLAKGAKLTCTSLGRHLERGAKVKHKIKTIDRLLGNKHLLAETEQIYKDIIYPMLSCLPELFINVDWSGCCGSEFHMLRATLQYNGRGITLYNEIHPQAKLGNAQVHKKFLRRLKAILPPHSHVTLVTDAGFATPWFHEVVKLGWDYVGRINRKTAILFEEEDDDGWIDTVELGAQASASPKYKGTGKIGKKSSTPVEGHVYVYKQPYRHRNDKSIYPDNNARHEKSNKSPWIIVTSLCPQAYKAKQIINIYKKRMQIEQNFRDDKNAQFGLGWRLSGTQCPLRRQILLLLAFIANFFFWLIALVAESQNLHYHYQANSIKHRRVLSFSFLAREIIQENTLQFEQKTVYAVAKLFANFYLGYILCA